VKFWQAAVSSAHGNYLQIAAELGWTGLGATICTLVLAVDTSWCLFKTVEDPFLRAIAAGIGASIIGQSVASILGDYLLPCYQNAGHTNISVTLYSWMLIGALMSIEARAPGWQNKAIDESFGIVSRFTNPLMGATEGLNTVPRVSWVDLGSSLLPFLGLILIAGSVVLVLQYFARCRISASQRQEALDARIRKRMKKFSGRIGVYAKDLTTGQIYAYQADETFPAARLFKVFVMVQLFRRAEECGLDLANRVMVTRNGISASGPGVIRYLHDEPELTLMDCCRLMVTWDDDMATDFLLKILKHEAVNHTIAQLGYTYSHVAGNCTTMKYRMADIDLPVVCEENEARLQKVGIPREVGFADRSPSGTVTTPREMGSLLERLFRCDIFSPKASEHMLDMMRGATKNSRSMIPRFLPEDILVAHRDGGSWGVLADAGIVDLSGRPVVMSIFTYREATAEGSEAEDLIADLSRILFDWSRTLVTQ
jgi:beta-lactamase class A